MKSGRHIRAKPRASRLMNPTRRPFSSTRECEASVSREVRGDTILREVEVPIEGSKDVCEVVYIAGDADETSQDTMTKYNEVNCVDKSVEHRFYRDGGAREPDGSGCTRSVQWREVPRILRAHDHELPGA